MKIIRFIKAGEIIQLGIDKKELFLKWGSLPRPMKLGTLEQIRSMAKNENVSLGDKKQKVPRIVKEMINGITEEAVEIANKYTDKEFYNDFLTDYKEMSAEGQLNFIGEFNEWA